MRSVPLFQNGGSQAVRLPKEFSFAGTSKVMIHKCGNKVILERSPSSWQALIEGIEMLPSDFELIRELPQYHDKGDIF